MWSRFPKQTILNEKQVNTLLNQHHLFKDPATLRRVMIGFKMLSRTKDASEYQRLEQKPPAEAVALIRRLNGRGQKTD